MKKLSIYAVILVSIIAFNLTKSNLVAYADDIEFFREQKSFTYNIDKNKKTSTQFDLNEEINRYNRNGNDSERCELLQHMLDIGIGKDVAIEYLYPNIFSLVERMEKNIDIKPKNASMKINTNSEKVFHITPEVVGIELDRDGLFNTLCDAILNERELKIEIPTKRLQPKIVAEHYKRYTHLRADFRTDISSSSADRKHNIKNALNAINKITIAPSEVFSFNKAVGRRTEGNGYRTAKIIINNEFVDGVGGGVCQVSSTLYNTALLAGLDIVEANKHSKQVGYVKYGFDAMVNFGSSDLRFRNNTSEKITIITNYTDKYARIRIFGEDMADTKYVLSNEIVKVEEPNEEIKLDEKQEYLDKVRYEDEYFYLKNAIKGMQIKSYREKYVSGKLVDKELLRFDKFKPQNAVKVYGIEKRETSILDILKDI